MTDTERKRKKRLIDDEPTNGNRKTRKRNSQRSKSKPSARNGSLWVREVLLIGAVSVTLLIVLSLISFHPLSRAGIRPENYVGIIGHYCASWIFTLWGYGGFLLIPAILFVAVWQVVNRSHLKLAILITETVSLIVLASTYFALARWTWPAVFPRMPASGPGGTIGNFLSSLLSKNLGAIGTRIIVIAGLLVILHFMTKLSVVWLVKLLYRILERGFGKLAPGWLNLKQRLLRWHYARLDRDQTIEDEDERFHQCAEELLGERNLKTVAELPGSAPSPIKPNKEKRTLKDRPVKLKPSSAIKIVERDSEQRGEYTLPPLNILKDPPVQSNLVDQQELIEKAAILEKKLSDFNIEGVVKDIKSGPVVSCYEFLPAPGVKISRIINLADDIALALKSKVPPRVAPVPGKSVLGVEIPNHQREIVYFKEIIGSPLFQRLKAALPIALGKDTRGEPVVTALESMPHLLIAGATGSGKSVCINAIMLGFLLTCTPDDLRLILVDPKMLELSDYNRIPHLRTEVITDVKLAPTALAWAVQEMERRFHLLAEYGVRNVKEYNKAMREQAAEARKTGQQNVILPSVFDKPLPYLVIIIDELADLMMVAAREIEEHIARLAQMGRAAGIHLILATQRPSVDVITGLIKANMPSRIAFQVSSKVDSRVIIDQNGAEKLLGQGDMLFQPPGTGRLSRLHGAYVDESEIKEIVEFWSTQARPLDDEDIFVAKEPEKSDLDPEDLDELYQEAVRIVVSTGIASISLLQRRLRVGHARAARLIDQMERTNIVGPFTGSKAREVLLTVEDLDRMNAS